MTSGADKRSRRSTRPPERRAGSARRPHDGPGSRQALLAAATELFDERGYDATTVREIGERAGVDAALIVRYFGSKEALYLSTLTQEGGSTLAGDPWEALTTILSKSETHGLGPLALAMVSPTLSDTIRAQVRAVVAGRALDPIADELAHRGVPDPRLRAEVLVAFALGLSLTRASGTLPSLADTPPARLLDVLEPLVDAIARSGETVRRPGAADTP